MGKNRNEKIEKKRVGIADSVEEMYRINGTKQKILTPDNNTIRTDTHNYSMGFPGCRDGKEFACTAGDLGLISGLGRFSGKVYSYLCQYSCLENSMDRGAWWAIVHGFAKSWTLLSEYTFTFNPAEHRCESPQKNRENLIPKYIKRKDQNHDQERFISKIQEWFNSQLKNGSTVLLTIY